jgi:serine phosphatase RsbU (regulator of sigma subunit)
MSFNILKIYKQLRVNFILAFSLFVLVVGITSLYFVFIVTPTSNDECLWKDVPDKENPGYGKVVFEKVKQNGVTWNVGIRNGDTLLAVNHKKFKSGAQAQETLNKVKAGNYATYTIKRANVTCNVSILIKKLIDFGMAAYTSLAFIWFVIGFIVIMAKPDGEVQRLFYKIGASFIFLQSVLITSHQYIFYYNPALNLLYGFCGFVSILAGVLMPFYFAKFFWVFPQKFKIVTYRYFNQIYYSLAALLFLYYSYRFIVYIKIVTLSGNILSRIDILNSIAQSTNLIFCGSGLVGFISLIINYIRVKDKADKKPILIILIAYMLGILALLYTALIAPRITDTIFNSPTYYAPIIIVIILPISFGYSIFKYQLMDVSVVIKNTIIYGAATAALAGIYFGLIYLLGQSVSMAMNAEYRGIIAASVFIVFAIAFQSTKDKLQDIITRSFYPEQFAFQKVLINFSNDVSSMVGQDNILSKMQATFVNSLKLNQFAILLKEEGSNIYIVKNCFGVNADNFTIDEGASNLNAYLERKAVSVNNPMIEQMDFPFVFPEESEELIKQNIYTIIPLIIKSKVIGLLLFGLKYSGSQFAGKDIELLSSAANQSAIAIENARLYDLESQKMKIEIDLDLARKIQQGLLPRCIPNINGLDVFGSMIPAMQVGGDYFDIIKVSENKLFVIIGDVSGKGLSASLYMAKLQTMLQLICSADKTPKELLIELNRRLFDSLEKNWFITMSVALFDLDENTVSFCRAGHVPVIMVNKTEHKTFQPLGLGVGLEQGKVFDATLAEQKCEIEKGDIWAFVSDGVTEAMDESQNLFGIDDLIKILNKQNDYSALQIVSSITASLQTFRGKAEQNDDITAVIVKIK